FTMSDTEKNEARVSPTPSKAGPHEPNGGPRPILVPATAESPATQSEGAPALTEGAEAEPTKADAPSLRNNALRPLREGLTALVGSLIALSIMALDAQFRWGVPLGFLAVVAAAFEVMDFIGSFDDPEERVQKRIALGELGQPLAE